MPFYVAIPAKAHRELVPLTGKAQRLWRLGGTTEVVPFYVAIPAKAHRELVPLTGKTQRLWRLGGTTEVVPFPKPFFA